MPQAGKDYPGSYAELLTWFPDEPACLEYLEWLRWPDGFRCPRCVGRAGWRLSSGRWECAVCGRQVSVTAGTIFHRTRTPLRLWFAAAWEMISQKHGVSALGIQRSLGLGSYQTAWAMLHRYRKAMVRPGRERLAGWVEVDEAYLGGVEGGVFGRQTDTKAIVAIAVEIKNPKGFGRIRLQRVDDVSKDSLIPFIESAVEPGATVHTDGRLILHLPCTCLWFLCGCGLSSRCARGSPARRLARIGPTAVRPGRAGPAACRGGSSRRWCSLRWRGAWRSRAGAVLRRGETDPRGFCSGSVLISRRAR